MREKEDERKGSKERKGVKKDRNSVANEYDMEKI